MVMKIYFTKLKALWVSSWLTLETLSLYLKSTFSEQERLMANFEVHISTTTTTLLAEKKLNAEFNSQCKDVDSKFKKKIGYPWNFVILRDACKMCLIRYKVQMVWCTLKQATGKNTTSPTFYSCCWNWELVFDHAIGKMARSKNSRDTNFLDQSNEVNDLEWSGT